MSKIVYAVGDCAAQQAGGSSINKSCKALFATAAYDEFWFLGDVYQTGTNAEFTNDFDPLWGTIFRAGKGRSTPGNHGWGNHTTGFDVYHAQSGDNTFVSPHYGAYMLGDWWIVWINSMEGAALNGGGIIPETSIVLGQSAGPAKTMMTWLDTLFAANPGTNKIVICHHNVWGSSAAGTGGHADLSQMQPLWTRLPGNASFLICGHNHNQEYHQPRNAAGNAVSFNQGQGVNGAGATIEVLNALAGNRDALDPSYTPTLVYSTDVSPSKAGVIKLVLSDTGLANPTAQVTWVNVDGTTNAMTQISSVTSGTTDTTPPSTATLTLGTPTTTTIPMTMTATDDVAVAGFDVYQAPHGGGFTQIATNVASGYSATTLTAATQYDFKVKAVDSAGNRSVAYSTVQTATTAAAVDTTPPSTATLSLGSPTSSTIPLTMTATDNVAVSGFDVYQAPHGSSTYTQIATNVTSIYTASGLAATTQYDFKVKAVDTSGNRSAAFSTIQTATTTSGGDTTPPSQATLALGTLANTSMVATMTATDNVAVAGFDVYQALHGGTFTQIATNVASPYSITGLASATQYDIKAKAVDTSGNRSTAFSTTQTASTTSATDVTPPTAPTALTATLNGATGINLAWTAATDNVAVTNNQVWRDPGTGPIFITTLGAVTTFADSGLAPSTHYTYFVKAVDAAGNVGPQSNTAGATTPASSTDTVVDTFARNVTNGWGTSDSGHVWSQDQGTNTQIQVVSGTGATISIVATNAPIIAIHSVNQQDYDETFTYKFSALPTGGKQNISLGVRFQDVQNYTRVRVDQAVGGHAIVGMDRQIGGPNTILNTGGVDFDTGAAQAINTLYKLRFQCIGTSVKAKVWLASAAEPVAWTVTGSDTVAPVLQGGICVRSQGTSGYTGGGHYTITGFNGAPAGVLPPVAPSGGTPSLSDDTPAVGQVLTAAAGSWSGTAPIAYGYLWQVSATGTGGWTTAPGSGATTANYTVASGDATKFLQCVVTATNTAGSASATSEVSSAVVAAGSVPVNTAAPVVSPTASLTVGSALSVTNGSWTNTPTSFQYKWLRVDPATNTSVVISGATTNAYTTSSTDSGFEIRAQVQATNGSGGSGYISSNLTSTVGGGGGGGTIVVDDSGNGLTGTLIAGSSGLLPTGGAGVSGLFGARGLHFDGTGGRVEISDPAGVLNSIHWTLGGWIKLPASPGNSDPAQWRYEMSEKAGVRWINVVYSTTHPPAPQPAAVPYVVRIGGFFGTPGVFDNLDSVHPLVPGTAAHIAGTYDGVNLKIYINGVLDSSKARTGDTASTTEPLVIGAKHRYLNGELLEAFMPNNSVIEGFFVADHALSQAEITAVKGVTFPVWADVGQSYTPVTGDLGNLLRPRQVASNRAGTAGDVGVPSQPIAGAPPPTAPVNVTLPALDDTAYQEGDTASAIQGTWTGTPTPSVSDRIQTSASPAGPWAQAAAPNQPYIVPTDGSAVGQYLRVHEVASNLAGTVTKNSPAIGPVTAIGPTSKPVDITPPTLTPTTVTAGVVMTVTPGQWTGDTGVPVYTFWGRPDSNTAPSILQTGASLTYIPLDTDVQVQVEEDRSNVNGMTAAFSAWYSPPAPLVITPLFPIPNQALTQERIVSLWGIEGQMPPGEAFHVRVDGGPWQTAIQSGTVLTCAIDLGADGTHVIDGDVF